MKSFVQVIAAATLLTASFSAFAQSTSSAHVRQDLVQLESVGYNPLQALNAHYPQDVQMAEARVAVQTNVASVQSDSVGGLRGGSSDHSAPGALTTDSSPYASLYLHR